MIKAIFFDIDGTLYDNAQQSFVNGSIKAIQKAKQLNPELKCFLCTARPYDSFRRLGVFDLGIEWDGYVASAGSLAFADGKYIHKDLVPSKNVYKFLSSCQKRKLTCELVEPKKRVRIGSLNEIAKSYYTYFQEHIAEEGEYQEEEVCLFNLFSTEDTDLELKRENPSLTFYRYSPYGSDVVAYPHSKGETLRKVLAHYSLKKEEAAGFGDDIQDISLAKEVGTFLAMGNAKKEVKEVASYVCPSCEEDGIAQGLFQLGLIPLPSFVEIR